MTRVLPLLAIIFVFQCFFIPQIFPELQLGNLYFIMAIMLCSGVVSLYLYDTQLVVFVKDYELYLQVPLLKISTSYSLKELETIDVYDADQPFSNIKLYFGQKKKTLNLYFIDNPSQVIQKLWETKVNALKNEVLDNSKAA